MGRWVIACIEAGYDPPFADEAGATVLAFDGVPGKAYEPRGWELFAQVRRPPYATGVYAEVADP